jgi:hypothetical protein
MPLTQVLCKRDPVLTWIRETYSANPLKVPESRVQPLTCAISSKGKTHFVGELAGLIIGGFLAPPIDIGYSAILRGKQTTKLSAEFATPILLQMLSSLGGADATNLKPTSLKSGRSEEFSFSFPDATRKHVDIIKLGAALSGKTVEKQPLTLGVLDGSARLLVIDSIFESTALAINAIGSRSGTIAASLMAAFPSLKIEEKAEDSFVASATAPVTFAFSCISLTLDESGRIQGFDLHRRVTGLNVSESKAEPQIRYTTFGDELAFLEWDEIS